MGYEAASRAAGCLGESAAEEEQEQELLDSSERYSGASEGETEERRGLALLSGHRRGQTERGGALDPRPPSQEQQEAAAGV